MGLEQVIQETKGLSANDRALLAHWLISSLETQQDEGVDAAWLSLAEQRLDELETGKVQGVSWEEIKAASRVIGSTGHNSGSRAVSFNSEA